MNDNLFSTFCLMIALASCSNNHDHTANEQGTPIANDCGMPGGAGRPCRLSQVTLLGNANAFTRKEIQMVSYLALDSGRLAAYPSRELFLSGDRFSSVELTGPYQELKDMSHRFAYQYVYIRGTFIKHSGVQGSESRFGTLNKVNISGPAMPGIEDSGNLDPDIVVDIDGS